MNHTTIYNPDGSVREGINVENLTTLYKGLLGEISPVIDPGDTAFEMAFYSSYRDGSEQHETTCGTAGCATGWAPFFGIEKLTGETWQGYSCRVFIDQLSESNYLKNAWTWCFGSEWANSDNTRRGAGLRIKHLLEHGIPEDWLAEMFGFKPLTYIDE